MLVEQLSLCSQQMYCMKDHSTCGTCKYSLAAICMQVWFACELMLTHACMVQLRVWVIKGHTLCRPITNAYEAVIHTSADMWHATHSKPEVARVWRAPKVIQYNLYTSATWYSWRPLYKGHFSRSQIIHFPIVLIQFEPLRRGQPLYKGHNSWLYIVPKASFVQTVGYCCCDWCNQALSRRNKYFQILILEYLAT